MVEKGRGEPRPVRLPRERVHVWSMEMSQTQLRPGRGRSACHLRSEREVEAREKLWRVVAPTARDRVGGAPGEIAKAAGRW